MNRKELVRVMTQEKVYREKMRGRKKNFSTVKDADEWLDVLLTVVEDALFSDEKVKIVNFGTLETRTHSAYDGSHPQTGEPIHVPEVKTIKFTPSQRLKGKLRGKEEAYGEYRDEDDEYEEDGIEEESEYEYDENEEIF